MSKKVLITGAAGFIGRHLIEVFKEKGIETLGIDNVSVPEMNIKECSILNYQAVVDAMEKFKPDAIVHLAAIALATYENISEIYNVNVCGSENLLKAATQVCVKGTRMVLVSTAGVYGNQNKEFYDESLPFNPENHYSYSKMVVELLSKQYEDLDIKIVRPFNIIGVGQRSVFLIPKLVEHFALRKPELRIGNLKPERDYVDVEYCTNVLSELAVREEVTHRVYNICSGIGHSVQDVIDILTKHCNYCPEIVIDERFIRKNEVWRMVGDPKRLTELLNGKTYSGFEKVIIEMCDYYKNSIKEDSPK